MSRSFRILVGAVAMLAFVGLYALVVMGLAHGPVGRWPTLAQTLFYAVAGLAWILPIMPLIHWMERGGRARS